MIRKSPEGGIVLVLVAGMLALLFVVSAGFLSQSRLWSRSVAAVLLSAQADLAADSGMEYAVGRLWRDPAWPAPASVETRGDDWQGPIAYDHGEPWTDAEPPGDEDIAYDPGEAFRDADGDGARDAYSGRLRGTGSPRLFFTLSARTGQISVNDENTVLFNNLGAVLGKAENLFGCFSAATQTGAWIDYSDLGARISANRPADGYMDLESFRRLMGLSDREFEVLEPFLCLTSLWGPQVSNGHFGPQGLLCLNGTPPEVLEALWRYRLGRGKSRLAGLPAGNDTHTGRPFSDLVILADDEAAALAAATALRVRRDGPFQSWQSFWDFMEANRDLLFPYAAVSDPEREAYQKGRMALAFWAAQPNIYSYMHTGIDGSLAHVVAPWAWGRWPQTDEERFIASTDKFIRPPVDANTYADLGTTAPYDGLAPGTAPKNRMLLGYPGRFFLESTGRVEDGPARTRRSREGEFELSDALYLTSQEDFENLGAEPSPPWSGSPRLLSGVNRDVTVYGRGDLFSSGPTRTVTSLPRFSQDAFHDGSGSYGFPVDQGALTVAAAQADLASYAPAPALSLRFDETGPVPETDANDNQQDSLGVNILNTGANALMKTTPRFNQTEAEIFPFWAWTWRKVGVNNIGASKIWRYRTTPPFPGHEYVGHPDAPGTVRVLPQAAIECWVNEMTPAERPETKEIWSLRVWPYSGSVPMKERSPEMGLKLCRAADGKYRVVWYGPWFDRSYPPVPPASEDAAGNCCDFDTEDGTIADAPADRKILIEAAPPPPGDATRIRHVCLLLNHRYDDPVHAEGMELYIDGQKVGFAQYPVPFQWSVTEAHFNAVMNPWFSSDLAAWDFGHRWNYMLGDYHPPGGWVGTVLSDINDGTMKMLQPSEVNLVLQGADEWVLTVPPAGWPWGERCISPAEIANRAKRDRFRKTGAYVSPFYRLAAPKGAVPMQAVWTGIRPEGTSIDDLPASALRVRLAAFDEAGAPLWTGRELADSAFTSIPDWSRAAYLRFTVDWDCHPASDRLVDPPVFEDLMVQCRTPLPRRLVR